MLERDSLSLEIYEDEYIEWFREDRQILFSSTVKRDGDGPPFVGAENWLHSLLNW